MLRKSIPSIPSVVSASTTTTDVEIVAVPITSESRAWPNTRNCEPSTPTRRAPSHGSSLSEASAVSLRHTVLLSNDTAAPVSTRKRTSAPCTRPYTKNVSCGNVEITMSLTRRAGLLSPSTDRLNPRVNYR